MELIKENNIDSMKNIVRCDCHHKEYFGMVVMRNGINYCRSCIYEIWQQDSNYQGWKPNINKNFVFPLYEDGIDYTEETNE